MADREHPELQDAANKMRGLLDGGAPAPEAEPQAQAQEVSPEPETELDQVEETQQDQETIEAEAETVETEEVEAESDATETEAEPGAETYELGADELAGLLGIDENKITVTEDGAISFKSIVDGKESDVNLSDLVNAYQGNANLTNRSKQIAELEKQRRADIEAFQTLATQQAQQAAITLEAINNNYLAEYNSIDWANLKAEDPAAYAAKSVEMSQKRQELDNLIHQTVNAVNEQQKVVDNENAKLSQQRLIAEQGKMQEGFKALNVKVDETLQKDVIGYLTEQFDPFEMGALVDHRMMLMAYKAMQFDKGSKTAKSKRVKKIPKVLKSGQKPSKQAVKLSAEKKQRAKLKESGSVDDAVSLLRGRLNG